MPIRHVQPKRRRLPGASDDTLFRVFMITIFWLAVVGVVLLFLVHWLWGTTLLGLCLIAFLGALLFGA